MGGEEESPWEQSEFLVFPVFPVAFHPGDCTWPIVLALLMPGELPTTESTIFWRVFQASKN